MHTIGFKILIMKQNIQISELGYEFVCEFEGLFYLGIVKNKKELGIRICDLNYGQVREYSLKKLEEWEDLMNLDVRRVYKGTL